MEVKKLVDSFSYALEGIGQALQTERNLKIHLIVGTIALVGAVFLGLSRLEFLILFLVIALVVVMELFNTVVERLIDLISPNFHPRVRIIKNMAAGAVLIAAVNAAVTGFILFYHRLDQFSLEFFIWLSQQPAYLTLFLMLLLLLVLLGLKYRRGEVFSLQGGMPSLHSAIAFSLATVIAFYTTSPLLIFTGYFLALLVAQSRVEGKIHNFPEVIWGGVLGFMLTVFIFQFFAGG